MKEVFIVSNENKNKAEQLLRSDDLISRQSITVKSAQSLDIKEDGYFIIINGSDDAIKKAEEMLKDIAEKYENKDIVIKKNEEQEDTAISGFGNILG